ncbi:effector-associated domain EAD1-containing protein [Scytonema sp. NUACC26]|uniref:effector-associated domain EAD1-containing protein n=1 Tax=Scytonema sp. NUACC26 TaxID=3140176 RepID=UPI0034DC5489
MLSFELNRNLDEITVSNNLAEIAFSLIKTAEAQEWIEDLISSARKSNPGNLKLQAIVRELNRVSTKAENWVADSKIRKINNLVNTAKEILERVNSSLIENLQVIIPFLQNNSKRDEVWSKVHFLFQGQRDRGNFGRWQSFLEAILETEEDPQLQGAINQLIEIILQFYKSFYSYYRSSTKNPKKFQLYKYDKDFVVYALNKECSGFTDEEVALIAEEYLDYLRGLVEKMGSIIGRLETAKDKSNRYHFWDYDSDTKNHTLSLPPEQVIQIEATKDSFNPGEFVIWDTKKSPWFLPRDWGSFS